MDSKMGYFQWIIRGNKTKSASLPPIKDSIDISTRNSDFYITLFFLLSFTLSASTGIDRMKLSPFNNISLLQMPAEKR